MDCFDREFLEILGNDIADEKEKPELLNEGMIQISSNPINQKENDSELDVYIKEAFGVGDEYDELPEEDDEVTINVEEYTPDTFFYDFIEDNVALYDEDFDYDAMEKNKNEMFQCWKDLVKSGENEWEAAEEAARKYSTRLEEEDFDFDKLSDEENELASDEYEPELEDEEELLTEKTNESKNNNKFVAESFNANPSLPDSDKKLLVFWGYEPKDFPQIELAMQKATFEDEDAKLLSAKEAEKYLGHKEFLSGLARCAFHGSAVRYPDNDYAKPSVYFDFDLANA